MGKKMRYLLSLLLVLFIWFAFSGGSPNANFFPRIKGAIMYVTIPLGADQEVVQKWGSPNAIFGHGPGYHDWHYFKERVSFEFDPDGKLIGRKLD